MLMLFNETDFHQDTCDYFKGKSVAITGGTGFIGSHVVEQLLTLGAKPIVLTRQKSPVFLADCRSQIELRHCDLNNFDATKDAMQDAPIILSLAAKVAGLEYNSKHPASIFRENLSVFFNTIQAAAELEVERFLVTSSACVYPRFCKIPTPETEGFVDEPEPTNSGYGWSKRMEEYLGKQYAKEFGLPVAIARPYNAYGPRDNFNPETSHVIPALIMKAFQTNNGELSVWGDGSHSRSFLYVEDFARGLLETAARYPNADPVNIGANEEITIKDLAHLIANSVTKIRGNKITPIFDSNGLTGQPRRHCDTTKAESLLNYRAKVSLEAGIQRTTQWYNEYENCSVSTYA